MIGFRRHMTCQDSPGLAYRQRTPHDRQCKRRPDRARIPSVPSGLRILRAYSGTRRLFLRSWVDAKPALHMRVPPPHTRNRAKSLTPPHSHVRRCAARQRRRHRWCRWDRARSWRSLSTTRARASQIEAAASWPICEELPNGLGSRLSQLTKWMQRGGSSHQWQRVGRVRHGRGAGCGSTASGWPAQACVQLSADPLTSAWSWMLLSASLGRSGSWQRGCRWLQASGASLTGSSHRFWGDGASRKLRHGLWMAPTSSRRAVKKRIR